MAKDEQLFELRTRRKKNDLPPEQPTFTMRPLITRRRALLLIVLLLAGFSVLWVLWNRPRKADLSVFAPSDSLAFVETNDLAALATGIDQTQAWGGLAGPIGAPTKLSPNRFGIAVARWTGIGSTDAILYARAQAAVVFSGAEGSQSGSTLTIKPLATFIIETHTSQWRMKATVERHVEELARRVYKNPVLVRKLIENIELTEWATSDDSHRIVTAFYDSTVIVGNDEASVLRLIKTRAGNNPSLQGSEEFNDARKRTDVAGSSIFGFVSQLGIKSLLQAFALSRSGSSADAVTGARIFADVFGGVMKSIGWTARFRDGMVEDRCSIKLADGVSNKLRASVSPDRAPELTNLPLVPPNVHSVSLYQFHDSAGFWSDLNAAISSHTDLVGSVAARPLLRSLLKPYGIEDADGFAHAIGTRLQTIRFDESGPSVLAAQAFDPPALRRLAERRLGKNPKSEKVGENEMNTSSDNWAAAFADSYFLIGPADLVRRCLVGLMDRQSIASNESFRKSRNDIDVSLPIFATTFTNDQRAAISFVEAFSNQQRSAFATTGGAIEQVTRGLPMAVSITILKDSSLEWTARSSFGIGGSFAAQLLPENQK